MFKELKEWCWKYNDCRTATIQLLNVFVMVACSVYVAVDSSEANAVTYYKTMMWLLLFYATMANCLIVVRTYTMNYYKEQLQSIKRVIKK